MTPEALQALAERYERDAVKWARQAVDPEFGDRRPELRTAAAECVVIATFLRPLAKEAGHVG